MFAKVRKVVHTNIGDPDSVFEVSLFQPHRGPQHGFGRHDRAVPAVLPGQRPATKQAPSGRNIRTALHATSARFRETFISHFWSAFVTSWRYTNSPARCIRRYPIHAFPFLRVFSQSQHGRTSRHGAIHNTGRYTLWTAACI
jgi:hypothetical protein